MDQNMLFSDAKVAIFSLENSFFRCKGVFISSRTRMCWLTLPNPSVFAPVSVVFYLLFSVFPFPAFLF